MDTLSTDERHWRHAPRWEALLAALAIAIASATLPDDLRLGPRWLLGIAIVLVAIPLNIARFTGHFRLTRILGMTLSALATVANAASAIFLIARLPGNKTPPAHLLRDGALIWGINILVFAIWYWELDCGGPHARHIKRYTSTDFLFPQMAMPDAEERDWAPRFMDYLFQAFNTNTAFSPTDVLILSRRAKGLMMAQSLISLVVIAVLVSRAINTLNS